MFSQRSAFNLIIRLSLMAIMAFAAFSGLSCQTQPPIPPTPTQNPSPPTSSSAGKWTADGVISPGEYPSTLNLGDYAISWRSDGQFIYAAMQAKTTGFVAVGFKPTQFMLNADMVFGYVKDGQVNIYDMHSTGEFGPHPPDTNLGGTNDIIEFGGKEEGGYTTIEFKRALNTNDKYDQPLLPGTNKIIWSYGLNDEITQQHAVRGSGEIGL